MNLYRVFDKCYAGTFNGKPVCFHWVLESYTSSPLLVSSYSLWEDKWKHGIDKSHFDYCVNSELDIGCGNPWNLVEHVQFENSETADSIRQDTPEQKKIFAALIPEVKTSYLDFEECYNKCDELIGADCWRVAVVETQYYEPVKIYRDIEATPQVDIAFDELETATRETLLNLGNSETFIISLGGGRSFLDAYVQKLPFGNMYTFTEVIHNDW